MKFRFVLLFTISLCVESFALPFSDDVSWITFSPTTSNDEEVKDMIDSPIVQSGLKISQMHITSDVRNRFVHTTVFSKVKNFGQEAQEATFFVILPESAFISEFIMEVGGQNYTAYVQEKEAAKRVYEEARSSGQSAAHVAVSARDSNRFTVSVNAEPQAKVAFYLTYEELLKRKQGRYELIVNIHPGQPVNDLSVQVSIHESRKLTLLRAPPLRSGNEIINDDSELDPRADIVNINDTAAIVTFSPNLERQKQLAHLMKTKEDDGLAGQFVVQYDVERDPTGGEVLVQNGYFVHFFAPSDLEALPKHAIFVLDTSGSMTGNKIVQLKDAMKVILGQLHEHDLFHLVEFNTDTKVWNLENNTNSVSYPVKTDGFLFPDQNKGEKEIEFVTFPNASRVNPESINRAKESVSKFRAEGGTDIYTALKVACNLIKITRESNIGNIKRQPIIIFLTDGSPSTHRESSTMVITKSITEMNSDLGKSSIFTLAFGRDADKKFLDTLSKLNNGFSTHIYEDADASLQLEDFYRGISSPLLSDVKFKYESSVKNLTKDTYPLYFQGSELLLAGSYVKRDDVIPLRVEGVGSTGLIDYIPTVKSSLSNVERLWAYLTIKELLEKIDLPGENHMELKKKATDLALKYSFVTSVTSLVVVKPNRTDSINTESDSVDIESKRTSISPSSERFLVNPNYHFDDSSSYDGLQLSLRSAPDGVWDIIKMPVYDEPKIDDASTISTVDGLSWISKFPWLTSLLNENGTVTLSSGNYQIESDDEVTETVSCPKTPTNETFVGQCKLINTCPQVHYVLKSLDIFLNYSCVLRNEFAGVCCPITPKPILN